MVARSVVTLGVSTERGAVHAVALAESGRNLSERVLLHRVERTFGDSKADVAAAVEAAMDEIAAEIGPDREIGGAAVAYRDAAERRAIVTQLASGPWQSTSLVSAKSAHLSVAGMMTWLKEFDHLLVCEVVPGHQSFTLVDRARSRVLAATSQAGSATPDTIRAAVTAAWDQLEAAAVRPDAVVLIGSGVDAVGVRAALDGFGAPVLPCKIATTAPAVGAAMAAMLDADVAETVEQVRHGGRGSAALFAAASVLAGGVIAGGIYTMNTVSGVSSPSASDADWPDDTRPVADSGTGGSGTGGSGAMGKGSGGAVGSGADGRSPAGRTPTAVTPVQPGSDEGRVPVAAPEPRREHPAPAVDTGVSWSQSPQWGDHALAPDPAEPAREPEQAAMSSTPGAEVPVPTQTPSVLAPNDMMLFPGESAPPPAFTVEAQRWWDNHLHLLMQWATQQLTDVAV